MRQSLDFVSWTGLVLALGLALWAAPVAAAGRVFLNGLEITGVRDQTFQKSTIRIDTNGDIFIEAPQYRVKTVAEAPSKPAFLKPDAGGPNPQLSQRYYLVTQPSAAAPACELSILINGAARRVVKPASAPQLILEISAWLHPGDNEVLVSGVSCNAALIPGATPARLIIGRGHEENRIVKVDEVLLTVLVGASTAWPVSERRLLLAK